MRGSRVDWFERLTGFRETTYDDTRRRLDVDGGRLRSAVNGKSYGIGELELARGCRLLYRSGTLTQDVVRSVDIGVWRYLGTGIPRHHLGGSDRATRTLGCSYEPEVPHRLPGARDDLARSRLAAA